MNTILDAFAAFVAFDTFYSLFSLDLRNALEVLALNTAFLALFALIVIFDLSTQPAYVTIPNNIFIVAVIAFHYLAVFISLIFIAKRSLDGDDAEDEGPGPDPALGAPGAPGAPVFEFQEVPVPEFPVVPMVMYTGRSQGVRSR